MTGIDNQVLVNKGVIVTDALAAAGKLNPAQSDKFIDYVVDQSVLSKNARVIRFRNESLEIDKIGIGRRVAMAAVEAQDPNTRRGITTSKVTLTPREVIVPFELGDSVKEINLEGEALEDHIIRMMATQLANDLEELYILGDTLGPARTEADMYDNGSSTKYVKDQYMALANGWSRLADSGHIYDAAGANISLSTFGGMLRRMPTKFRRNLAALRYFVSPDLWQLYTERLATRATPMGDAATEGKANTPFGVPAVSLPLWPMQPRVVEHVVLTGTTAAALRFGPVSNVVVLPESLDKTPETPYIVTTDYVVDATAGTIARSGGGSAIGSGNTVKVTYDANPQILLTHAQNFIMGIGRDIRIEKGREIFKRVNQYVITCKVSVQFEEIDAVVKAKNIGTTV